MSQLEQTINLSAPGENLDAYLSIISSVPLLTAEQEQALAKRLHYRNDLGAARQLVMSHLRFVAHIANGYRGYGLPYADLIQEGNVGLMKAVKSFDPDKGVRLITFAVYWIKSEMHEYVLRNWRIVRVATTKAQRKLFFNLRSAKKHAGWLTSDEVNAIATDLRVPTREVREMEARLSTHDDAFDMSSDEDDDTFTAPVNFLEDKGCDPARLFEKQSSLDDASERLRDAMGQLDDRGVDIITQRWLAENKATLSDLAQKYHISIERVRQLEQNAMKKIKATLEA